MRDPTDRFGDRADDYVRYRPGYPDALIECLRERGWLQPGSSIADVGAGTGLSSRLFLDAGCVVHAVEPNAPMRAAAERALAGSSGFHSIAGRAEATTLGEASIDLVVAGTAFHWFEPEGTRREFARITRPPGRTALFWNLRRADTCFMSEYAQALVTCCPGYAEADQRRRDDPARLAQFFRGDFDTFGFDNDQRLDFDGLLGRVLSSSYAPRREDAGFAALHSALRTLFDRHGLDGTVTIRYETRLYLGTVH